MATPCPLETRLNELMKRQAELVEAAAVARIRLREIEREMDSLAIECELLEITSSIDVGGLPHSRQTSCHTPYKSMARRRAVQLIDPSLRESALRRPY